MLPKIKKYIRELDSIPRLPICTVNMPSSSEIVMASPSLGFTINKCIIPKSTGEETQNYTAMMIAAKAICKRMFRLNKLPIKLFSELNISEAFEELTQDLRQETVDKFELEAEIRARIAVHLFKNSYSIEKIQMIIGMDASEIIETEILEIGFIMEAMRLSSSQPIDLEKHLAIRTKA